MPVLKIGFTGAGGTGKGTLMRRIHEQEPWIKIISSPMQFIGKNIDEESSNYKNMLYYDRIKMQYASVFSQMNAERIMKENDMSFMSERSVLDFIPYMYELCQSYKEEEEYKRYENIIINYLKNKPYDMLVYLPIEFEPKDIETSSWKERNSSDRKRTDLIINEWLAKLKKNTNIIKVKGSIEERVISVSDKVKEIICQL